SDEQWISDAGVKETILGILRYVAEEAELTIQGHALAATPDLTIGAADDFPRPCSLTVRLSLPKTSPLLAKASKATALEDKLQGLMSTQHEEYQQNLYIPPQCKTVHIESKDMSEDEFKNESEVVSDEGMAIQSFPLMVKVNEFLESDRQVFLVLGDSGAGKSTFN
ncbi:hypothetical protein BGX24_008142, partial [Mortierella sp. AD032]